MSLKLETDKEGQCIPNKGYFFNPKVSDKAEKCHKNCKTCKGSL